MRDIDVLKNKLAELGCDDLLVHDVLQEIEKKLYLYEAIEKTLYDSELYLVYKHTDPVGKVYIGITKNLPGSRWNEGTGYEKQKKFYKAIQKYGWIHFQHEIIAAGLTESEARTIEKETIIALCACDEEYGYNTRLSLSKEESASSLPGKNEKIVSNQAEKQKSAPDLNDIASSIIEKFSIKTVKGKMYQLQNKRYVYDQNIKNAVKHELLVTYNLPPRKHIDVIRRIEILSVADSLEPVGTSIINAKQDILVEFLQSLAEIFARYGRIQNEDLYSQYLLWAKQHEVEVLKKTVFAQRLRRVIKTVYPKVTSCRTSKSRGWKIED